MGEHYLLLDLDNRDDDGNGFHIKATSLAEFIPYVAGPLRGDMTGPEGREHCENAIDYLRRERFDLARQALQECGVCLSIEDGEFPVLAGLTERQAAAWPGAVAEAQRYVPCSTIPVDIDHYEWRVTWADETRPGRGRMIDATWCDGEYLVQVRMDVYGYPSVSVAETRWLHSGSYEECDCTWCEREREEETP